MYSSKKSFKSEEFLAASIARFIPIEVAIWTSQKEIKQTIEVHILRFSLPRVHYIILILRGKYSTKINLNDISHIYTFFCTANSAIRQHETNLAPILVT